MHNHYDGRSIGALLIVGGIGLVIMGVIEIGKFGREPPSEALNIRMPQAALIVGGIPAYDSPVQILVPFPSERMTGNFVFAEVTEDSVYKEGLTKGPWVRFRDGIRIPAFDLPLSMSTRYLSLQDQLRIPISDLEGPPDRKFWIRFGLVTFNRDNDVESGYAGRLREDSIASDSRS